MTTILKKKIPANFLTLLMFASIRPDRLTNATAVRNITLDGSQDVQRVLQVFFGSQKDKVRT